MSGQTFSQNDLKMSDHYNHPCLAPTNTTQANFVELIMLSPGDQEN